MHMNEDWVAAVRRSVVEIYKGNGQCFDAWKTIPLAHTVGCASFAELNDDRSTLRLFITSTDGLFVYDIVCNPSDELLSLTPIWHYVEPDTEDHDPVLTQGLIGVTTKALSWVHGCMMDRSFRLRFVHAAIPVGDQPPTLFEWHDPNMSVLHAYGVYDFDETRGILVIGNVYGELAIYDFSGSDPSWFDGCLASDLEAMPYTDEKLLSLVSGFYKINTVITVLVSDLIYCRNLFCHTLPLHFPIGKALSTFKMISFNIGRIVAYPSSRLGGQMTSQTKRTAGFNCSLGAAPVLLVSYGIWTVLHISTVDRFLFYTNSYHKLTSKLSYMTSVDFSSLQTQKSRCFIPSIRA